MAAGRFFSADDGSSSHGDSPPRNPPSPFDLTAPHELPSPLNSTSPVPISPHDSDLPIDESTLGVSRFDLPPSDAFPGYTLIRELSRGGQGVVYQALQTSTKRKVALKMLLAGNFAPEVSLKRFQREIELVAQLDHPNIVSVFDADSTRDGRRFFAMDYIRGKTLTDHLHESKSGLRAMLELFATICEAVNYAHQRGIIHRDLKPSNILVDSNGDPKILDFGLAKLQSAPAQTLVSMSHQFLGTLPYMSPEQVRGNPDLMDVRTDVYALGILLFHCLTKRFPYRINDEPPKIINNILNAAPKRPSEFRRDLNHEIDTVVGKCLAKERERRYANAGEIAEDLRRYLDGRPILAKRDSIAYVLRTRARTAVHRHPAVSLASAAALAALVGIVLLQPLVDHWTPLHRLYENAAAVTADHFGPAYAFTDLKIVTLNDETPIDRLVELEALPSSTIADPKGLRRLHGRFMQRLARLAHPPRVVGWDFAFVQESEHDAEFVDGVRALRAKGVFVVVATKVWPANGDGRGAVSPRLADEVRFACANLGSEHSLWRVPLAMQCGDREPLPSLSMAIVAAARHPNATPSFSVNQADHRVVIHYHARTAGTAGLRAPLADPDVIRAAHILRFNDLTEENAAQGHCLNDQVSEITVELPNDNVFETARLNYADCFTADSESLNDAFKDRILILADTRGDTDRHTFKDRKVPGAWGHAVVIQNAWNELAHPVRRHVMDSRWGYADFVVCAIAGALIGYSLPKWRFVPCGVALIALLGISAYLAVFRVLWNPIAPFGALVIAMELATMVRRRAVAD